MPSAPSPVTVHLIDASPYIFRSYFALPISMVDAGGAPINALYGFAAFLIKYIADVAPTHLGVTFDESLTTSFRNDLDPNYKAQRELPPPELEAQQKACEEVARALGIATYVHERYEADDLIGTLCARLLAEGHAVRVVTSDKDLAQLVGPRVTWANPARDEVMGPEDVRAKFGVLPAQIADYLGLAGDTVDNIPGVAGVGKKSAAALLAEFESLDALYAGLDRVAELPLRGAAALARKLAAGRDAAFLSRRLATIAADAPIEPERGELAHLELRGADRAVVRPLFERLGIGGLVGRIGRWSEPI